MTTSSMADVLAAAGVMLPADCPRDIAAIVPLQLPLAFVQIDQLTTHSLERWLACRRIIHRVYGPWRRLHGALVARAGRGVVFVDSTDDADEQRFTAAHETAHFISDHLMPRQRAIDVLGETIRPVLDGCRSPTHEESISAVLNRVPLGVEVHLMHRGPHGNICSWDVEKREQGADRLALEIVAPAEAALRVLRQAGYTSRHYEVSEAPRLLTDRFGLPISAAAAYARLLLDTRRSRRKLSESLIGGDE